MTRKIAYLVVKIAVIPVVVIMATSIMRSNPYIPVWPTSQNLQATLDIAEVSTTPRAAEHMLHLELEGLSHYWNPGANPAGYQSEAMPPYGDGNYRYYDDNAWIGLDLIQAYRLTHNAHLLKRAEQVARFEEYGEVKNPHDAKPGGELWTQNPAVVRRTTVSGGGATEVALELYRLTGQKHYLNWAKHMYAWVRDTLLGENGLYCARISPHGYITCEQLSYLQGLMIGDGVLLYQSTGEQDYLEQAKKLASASLSFYVPHHFFSIGTTVYNAIFFKNLLMLDTVAPNPVYRKTLMHYAAELWKRVNPQTGRARALGSRAVPMPSYRKAMQIYAAAMWKHLESQTGLTRRSDQEPLVLAGAAQVYALLLKS